MLEYKTIDYYGDYWGLPIVAFDKLDGSNLRFEYSKKRGFYKFGSRNVLIDETHDLGKGIQLFKDKYEAELDKIFRSKNYRDTQSFVCFAEFIGKNSEFGRHDLENDEFDVVLFDIDQHKKGFIPPKQFIKDFGALGIPPVVYEGNLNMDLVKDIKNNVYNLVEGVICKGVVKSKKGDNLYYCKIKANSWFDRLRHKDPELYNIELKQANNGEVKY